MNKNTPLVSIVLPTFNGSKYLTQSIDSCLIQSHKNLELIIIDDHSTDNTPQIIKSYNDKRIKYLRNGVNKHLPKSLNVGFSVAKGDFLTWTSDDNYYSYNAIEKMLTFLITNKCDFVYCAYYAMKNDNINEAQIVRFPPQTSLKSVNFVRACFLYSRKVKEIVGDYNPELELSEDYDYWIRVSKKFQLCYLKEPLYYYRYHDNALFSKRYWEQGIVKCLVRFMHGLCSKKEIINDLIVLYARKRGKRLIRPIFYFLGITLLKNFIKKILNEVEDKTCSLTDSKKLLIEKIL